MDNKHFSNKHYSNKHISHDREVKMEIKHLSHDHPLTLEIKRDDKVNCSACARTCSNNLIYSCKDCENYYLHKSCAELPERIMKHPFHPSHPLPLVLRGPNFACCGCGKWDSGILYWCRACNFTMSPDCALEPSTKYEFIGEGRIRHVLHKHSLNLQPMDVAAEEAEGGTRNDVCSACERRCSAESYYCPKCPNFILHKSCAEHLPRAVQHPSHEPHPLILCAKDSAFDQGCVACSRTDTALTYRCSMCSVEMDPECALAAAEHLI